MFSVLFLLSITCGALLFVKLASSDAWLAKGIKEDRIGAVIVACFLGICAIALLTLLYMFLPRIPASLAEAFAAPSKTFPAAEETHEAFVGDIISWFLLLCIPILSAYLLYWLYRTVHWVIKKSVSLCIGTKSR
jgi:uncharacterized membrane protein